VPGTLPEELVYAELRTDARGRTWGVLADIVEPHPSRVAPDCAQYRGCPGCPLRHAAPDFAAEWKLGAARRAFARIAGHPAPPGDLLQPVGRDAFRARLSAGRHGEVLGMSALPGEPPVDLRLCPAQTPASRAALVQIQADLEAAGVLDAVARVSVAAAEDTGDVRVAIGAVDAAALARLLAAPLPARPGRAVFVKLPTARDADLETGATALSGTPTMRFQAGEDTLQATMPAWVPQSPGTLNALRDWALSALQPAGVDVLELGCGVGTLSLPMARAARSLVGVDCVRPAIVDATENARVAGVSNARFRLGFADHAVRRLVSGGHRFEAVLLHGMRSPFGARLMDVLPAVGARRIAYLAPITASLARDTVALKGYTLDRLDFIDQMPGTAHLMALGLWTRRPNSS
jgi:23S rRNA (uracil1939-C5)-methyltransferase